MSKAFWVIPVLCGLVTPIMLRFVSQEQEQEQEQQRQQRQQRQLRLTDEALCKSFGLTPGTPQYTDCRMLAAQYRSARLNNEEPGK